MELPVQRVLAEIETAGIAVDLEAADRSAAAVRRARSATPLRRRTAVIGKQINLGSPKQLQVVLFDELEMPKTKRTKTGYTTDADALQSLYDKTGHPFLQHLLTHRDVTRLKVTVDGLLNSVATDGRIHTTFNQTIAATGRLSSTEPEPAEHPDSHRRRPADSQGVRGRQVGYAELMTADYSQIEMRIMAHLSKDEGLIEAFSTGEDLHSFVASRAFDGADRRGHPRTAAPGQGDVLRAGLRADRVRPGPAAEDLHRGSQGPDGASTSRGSAGCATTCTRWSTRPARTVTRRRCSAGAATCPSWTAATVNVREAAERAALNAPIQGSAADIIKVAMIEVADALTRRD